MLSQNCNGGKKYSRFAVVVAERLTKGDKWRVLFPVVPCESRVKMDATLASDFKVLPLIV